MGAEGGDTVLPKELEEERREIGRRIREARRGAGLTQGGLADKLGLRIWHVEQFESGEFRDEDLDRIAAAVGRSRSWLIHGGPPGADAAPTSGEAIRLLFESRIAARRAPAEDRQVEQAAEASAAARRAHALRRTFETLAREQAATPTWRRLLTRDSRRHLEQALTLIDKALELQAEVARRAVELDAELARARVREERLSEALSAALHARDVVVDEARTEAALLLRKARRRAQRLIAQGARERDRAHREIRGLRKVLDEASDVSRRMAESLQRIQTATSPQQRVARPPDLLEQLRPGREPEPQPAQAAPEPPI